MLAMAGLVCVSLWAGGRSLNANTDILQIQSSRAGLNLERLSATHVWERVNFRGQPAVRFTGTFTTRQVESLMGSLLATIYFGRYCRQEHGWSREQAGDHIPELLACAQTPRQVLLPMLFVNDTEEKKVRLVSIHDPMIDTGLLRVIAENLEADLTQRTD